MKKTVFKILIILVLSYVAIYIIGYFLSILLPSLLEYKEITHMDDEDLRWIEKYEVGDCIHFYSDSDSDSDSNKKDLMIVYSKDINNSLNPDKSLAFDKYIANAYIEFAILHRHQLLKGDLSIRKENNLFPVYIGPGLNNQHTILCNQQVLSNDEYAAKNYHLLNLKDTIISGIEYHDCFIIDETNSWQLETSEPSDEIQSFIWSKSKGLIQYTMKTGEVFTREEY